MRHLLALLVVMVRYVFMLNLSPTHMRTLGRSGVTAAAFHLEHSWKRRLRRRRRRGRGRASGAPGAACRPAAARARRAACSRRSRSKGGPRRRRRVLSAEVSRALLAAGQSDPQCGPHGRVICRTARPARAWHCSTRSDRPLPRRSTRVRHRPTPALPSTPWHTSASGSVGKRRPFEARESFVAVPHGASTQSCVMPTSTSSPCRKRCSLMSPAHCTVVTHTWRRLKSRPRVNPPGACSLPSR